MICKYCGEGCEQMTTPSWSSVLKWQCVDGCGVTYFVLTDGSPAYTIWDAYIKRKRYSIKIYDGATGNAPCSSINIQLYNVSGNPYWEEVVRLDYALDWTPQNTEKKLKNLLTFL